jgi:hypothetical protein
LSSALQSRAKLLQNDEKREENLTEACQFSLHEYGKWCVASIATHVGASSSAPERPYQGVQYTCNNS